MHALVTARRIAGYCHSVDLGEGHELVTAIAEKCPVHKVLAHGAEIGVAERAAAA